MDYTVSPPLFEVFPAKEMLDDMRYMKLGLAAFCVDVPERAELRRKAYERAFNSDGKMFAFEIILCGRGGKTLSY